jgi:hypothetical protein
MQIESKLESWLPLLLLLAGSVMFVAGGTFHPHVGVNMGVLGSPEFFTHFAQKMVATEGWVPMHMLILAGPVAWALAAPAVRRRLPSGGDSVWAIAQMALGISATLWIITFILDGLIAPVFARALISGQGAFSSPATLMSFASNQSLIIRIGLFSLILNGLAIMLFSIGLIVSRRGFDARLIVGVVGVLIGVWPFVAAITGEFSPGPFTSELWKETALAIAAWYVGLGLVLARGPAPAIATEKGKGPR